MDGKKKWFGGREREGKGKEEEGRGRGVTEGIDRGVRRRRAEGGVVVIVLWAGVLSVRRWTS